MQHYVRHRNATYLILFLVMGSLWSAVTTADELRLSAYCTAGDVQAMQAPEARASAAALLHNFGITRVILETNRGGEAVSEAALRELAAFYRAEGFAVAGGIATVPGGDWGVPASEGLSWLNFTHPKTQADLEAAVRVAARVFDDFIVDDFLLSGDKSLEADAARQGRSWAEYRRDLLVALSQRMIIGPAREENPDINLILKFPQSYDRYHTFGYDVEREPQLYHQIWVGTETRGQYTQRFGFTQPYEGFINYRWIASLSGEKMGGAWFDFGDCDGPDYVEQAWQTVLAGAREIVLFSFAGLNAPHPGHALLQQDLPELNKLAGAVAAQPVTGVAAYKPANSDPGSDMYIMDFVGMLGVPLVPVHNYPTESADVFVPAYGAKDPTITEKIEASLRAGSNVVITTGLLAGAVEGERLARLAGLKAVPEIAHLRTESVLLAGVAVAVPRGLDLSGRLEPEAADVRLEALVDGVPVPYLTTRSVGSGRLTVLNIHQFTQEDFDAVNEVLLSPRNLGLLDMPQAWANALRQVFRGGGEVLADAPTRVTIQPLGETGWFIQNYNNAPAAITLRSAGAPFGPLADGFSGALLLESGQEMQYTIPPRARVWVTR